MVFHYLEVIDALKLDKFDLVGHCVGGGWIAAELAVRHPEGKIRKLVLIGASGLFVEGALIGDIFMNAQPELGESYATFREMLFANADQANALEMFPDGKGEIEGQEVRRYQMLKTHFAHWLQAAVFLQSARSETACTESPRRRWSFLGQRTSFVPARTARLTRS